MSNREPNDPGGDADRHNDTEEQGESFLCCGCGNDHFRITPLGALCVFCGSLHEIILSGPPRLV